MIIRIVTASSAIALAEIYAFNNRSLANSVTAFTSLGGLINNIGTVEEVFGNTTATSRLRLKLNGSLN